MNLAVTADAPFCSRRYLVVPSHPFAGSSANDQNTAVIHKCRTTATTTMSPVQSALS